MTRAERRFGALVVAVLLVLACVAGAVEIAETDPGAHPGEYDFHSAITRHAEPMTRVIADGKAIFLRRCTPCHGTEGTGDGFNAYNLSATLGVKPADLTDQKRLAGLDDDMLRTVIRDGGAAAGRSHLMPAWGATLSPIELEEVMLWVRRQSVATDASSP